MRRWKDLKSAPKNKLFNFFVKNLHGILKSTAYERKSFKWFFDMSNRIAICKFDEKYDKAYKSVGMKVPLDIIRLMKDDIAIVYQTENEIYVSPYKLGEEHLIRYLKDNGLI